MKATIGSILRTSVPIVVDFGAQALIWTIEPILVGQRYGAGQFARAGKTVKAFLGMVGILVLFIAAIICFRARYFVIIYTSNPEVISLCVTILKIVALVQIPKAMSYIFSFSLKVVGENQYPMCLAIGGVGRAGVKERDG